MELILLLSLTLTILMTSNVYGAAINTPLDEIPLEDLSKSDREYLAYLNEQVREKRSEDILSMLKSKVVNGLKSKIGHLSSGSSHGGSSKGHHYYDHPPHESYDGKDFDFWDLQKSILHTLLQAAKAIAGGITAISGHVIRGGGYLVSAKGKLISAKGEAITNIGKHIATSANLSPHKGHHHHHTAPSGPEHEYGPPSSSGYAAPSGHGVEYHSPPHGPPPSGYSDHKYPPSIEAIKDHLPHGGKHGILILKKIPKGHGDSHNGNEGSHNQASDAHTPEEPSVPPFKFLPDVKDIFSASKGHDDTAPSAPSAPPSPTAPSGYSNDHGSHHVHDEHSNHHPDPPHVSYEHSNHHDTPHGFEHSNHHPDTSHGFEHSNHHHDTPHGFEHSGHHLDAPHSSFEPPSEHQEPLAYHGPPADEHHIPPTATSYGTPFSVDSSNANYFNNYNQPSGDIYPPQSQHGQLPIESYDPLQLPSSHPTPLTISFMNGVPRYPPHLRGYEHFPKYPVDLTNSYGAQVNFAQALSSHKRPVGHYDVHEKHNYKDLEPSPSEQKIIIPSPKSLKDPEYLHKFAMKLASNPNLLKKYITAYKVIQRMQSSHTRSVSRQKRPQNRDPVRSFTSRLDLRRPVRL